EDLLRDIRQVLLIVLRNEYRTQAHSVGGQELLLEPSNGENFATQSNFASHGDVTTHGDFRKRAGDGGADSDTGGRAVLRDGAFGDVYVNIDAAIKVSRQAERGGA